MHAPMHAQPQSQPPRGAQSEQEFGYGRETASANESDQVKQQETALEKGAQAEKGNGMEASSGDELEVKMREHGRTKSCKGNWKE